MARPVARRLLDLGADALVSAESAAALHGPDGFEPGPLVFLVPRVARCRQTIGTVISTPHLNGLDRTATFCFTTEDVRDDPAYVVATLTDAVLARAG